MDIYQIDQSCNVFTFTVWNMLEAMMNNKFSMLKCITEAATTKISGTALADLPLKKILNI